MTTRTETYKGYRISYVTALPGSGVESSQVVRPWYGRDRGGGDILALFVKDPTFSKAKEYIDKCLPEPVFYVEGRGNHTVVNRRDRHFNLVAAFYEDDRRDNEAHRYAAMRNEEVDKQ